MRNPSWGEILGIHENVLGDKTGAIIITDMGMVLLGAGDLSTWVRYVDVARIGTNLLQRSRYPQRPFLFGPRMASA